ncbi:hypothetical protein A3C34_03670 [Candidatus Amesbacteria bacterium RIFCSPHIGHO2_02_FULL_48_21]|uniref:Four helix bundle protein n=4 Tax=Candidatus Amesiibacteriota TaxID=1752730 RepID=A0A1F4Z7C4_9BACT|nr:MAG: hypothetical protein UX78_C0007G0018 [Candidatus Amesbacteria bacterium GW2011_GWA2_47_11]KKU99878.1 MAG: hypothetical protein UY33_C0020G0018 [Candidatus Amesbacteria bacterium GW2011_GWA1_48_9]OGC89352.1 MAG: hypothetical protein A2V48_03825 [Candidatus Amesbacteria bacterium RBG_19FT_COMBO_48_16]OGC97199.1 MAG: hypothetical protein A3C34_03670 [Candidatus Amesbacteria bacterium RIFCSPHIGHO2_02_FULL_48_21]OGC99821.1 MAG: hypothetical protein A2702_02580 [Candidatus Amesbacteria bacter
MNKKVFTNQLLRSTTSIGANFEEATESQTGKDVIYKLSVVKKEAKENLYWLDLISEAFPVLKVNCATLLQENVELIRIFASIISKKKANLNY